MTTFRDLVGAAYGKGALQNMSIADGPAGQRLAADVLAEMTSSAIALADSIANPKALSAADRAAATEAQRLYGWIKGLDQDSRSAVEAALIRMKARAA